MAVSFRRVEIAVTGNVTNAPAAAHEVITSFSRQVSIPAAGVRELL